MAEPEEIKELLSQAVRHESNDLNAVVSIIHGILGRQGVQPRFATAVKIDSWARSRYEPEEVTEYRERLQSIRVEAKNFVEHIDEYTTGNDFEQAMVRIYNMTLLNGRANERLTDHT